MSLKSIFSQIAALSLLLASCSSESRQHMNINIRIIETTDVHGSIFPFDYIQNKEVANSLASVYTFVKQQRANDSIETILLDNGDILQGQPVVYYSNFEKTNTEHICASVMNFMQYDAGTVGNHDIEAGHPVYDKLRKEFNFPWMAANAVDKKTGKAYFKPYTVINRKGVKIAILGMITPAIPNWLPEKIWKGIEFEDMVESAKKWVKIIKEKEHPDLLVGLFHSGVDYTYNNQADTSYKNENASKLVAEKVPGFDVVLAGHDHREYNLWLKSADSSDVLLIDPRSHARYMGVVDVGFSWDEQKKQYDKTINGNIVSTSDYLPDSVFMNKFADYSDKIEKYVHRPIGSFTKSVSSRDALFGDSEFSDLIHRIQLEISNADISFTAPLSYDTQIKKGKVYISDMFKLYRFENLLYTMSLSGLEIKNYLEYSTGLWFNEMNDENDHLLKLKETTDGKMRLASAFYNFSSAAGIDYTIDLKGKKGNRVHISSFTDGRKFSLDSNYTVAINSYRGNGGGGHLIEGAGIPKNELASRIVKSTEKDLRFFMIKWIEQNKQISPAKYNNWKLEPESWWYKAKQRDKALLFDD